MRTRNGGQDAKAGFWWNLNSWEVNLVKATGDTLPGAGSVRYVRIPTLALVLLGPAMGALFVMFLPVLGFAMLFGALATKIGKTVAATGRALAGAMHYGRTDHATPAGTPAAKGREREGGKDDDRPSPRS